MESGSGRFTGISHGEGHEGGTECGAFPRAYQGRSTDRGRRSQAALKVIALHTRWKHVASARGGARRRKVEADRLRGMECGRHPYGGDPLSGSREQALAPDPGTTAATRWKSVHTGLRTLGMPGPAGAAARRPPRRVVRDCAGEVIVVPEARREPWPRRTRRLGQGTLRIRFAGSTGSRPVDPGCGWCEPAACCLRRRRKCRARCGSYRRNASRSSDSTSQRARPESADDRDVKRRGDSAALGLDKACSYLCVRTDRSRRCGAPIRDGRVAPRADCTGTMDRGGARAMAGNGSVAVRCEPGATRV